MDPESRVDNLNMWLDVVEGSRQYISCIEGVLFARIAGRAGLACDRFKKRYLGRIYVTGELDIRPWNLKT